MSEIKKHRRPILAIDLGGTKLLTAIVSGEGQILARERYLTPAEEGPEAVVSLIFSAINSILGTSNMTPLELDGISVAAAGPVDMVRGIVTESPNLPGWCDVPLRDIIRDKLTTNTFLINDAKAAALGEHQYGAGKGIRNLIYLTVSTGIGGGIITNGQLYFGKSGSAGELGHMTIDVNGPRCLCGNAGCLEALASGAAMAKEAIRRVSRGEKSTLTEMAQGKIEEITAEILSRAAEKGDLLALDVIEKAATYLGVGLANIVNIFNPEMIIIGGGVSKMGELLLAPARRQVQERAFRLATEAVRIVPAILGDGSGVLGAAVFAARGNRDN